MALFNLVPTFTYPAAREYPIDEIAEEIVRELEKRNWNVPGITVNFDIYGSGEKRYMKVERIAGKEFALNYGREQGDLDSINKDSSALWVATISCEEVWMYPHGGPDYCRLSERKDVIYSPDAKKKYFVRNKGQGIPFSSLSHMPQKVCYDDTFNRFVAWLKGHVLDVIRSYPEAAEIKPAFKPEELIPYNGPWETVYYIDCDEKTAEFILEYQKDPKGFSPEKRYTHIKRRRTVSPLMEIFHNDLPREYFDSYIACEVNRKRAFIITYDRYFVVSIKPRYANGIYVVDRDVLVRFADKRNDETDLEMMKTMIPLNEYKDEYENPLVLFRREIDFDEIVLVERKIKVEA